MKVGDLVAHCSNGGLFLVAGFDGDGDLYLLILRPADPHQGKVGGIYNFYRTFYVPVQTKEVQSGTSNLRR